MRRENREFGAFCWWEDHIHVKISFDDLNWTKYGCHVMNNLFVRSTHVNLYRSVYNQEITTNSVVSKSLDNKIIHIPDK